MKKQFVLAILVMALFSIAQAFPKTDAVLDFRGYEIGDDFMTLNYTLPYDGMVEIRLFDGNNTLIWQNQYVNERGENIIRLKVAAFKTGQPYTIQLNYKQDIFRKDFTVNR